MTKASWGLKRHCPSCGAHFYDLGKNPASCPKCKYVQDINAPARPRRGRSKTVSLALAGGTSVAGKAVAKPDARLKGKKPLKEIEGVDLDKFEDIKTMDGDDIEELEDIDSLEEIEEIEESKDDSLDDEISDEVADKVLIDDVDDGEEDDEDEEEEDDSRKKRASKPAKPAKTAKPAKGKPKPVAAVKKKKKK